MVNLGSYVRCIDTTGVSKVKIFRLNVPYYNTRVNLGDTVIVIIKAVNTKTEFLRDTRIKFRFRRGSMHRAVVVHTKDKYKRANRSYI
jgi:ribosomal protein L14